LLSYNNLLLVANKKKYYSKNFEKIKDVISNLNSDNAISIAKAKDIMQNNELKNN